MTENTKYFVMRAIGYGLVATVFAPGWRAYALYVGLCMIDIWRKP